DVVVIFHLDVRHWSEEENNCEDDDDHRDECVWNPEPFTAGTDAGRIFRIEKRAACDRHEEQADAVDRLREIDPRRRVLRRTEYGGVRVRDRFEKGEARSDNANA